jgi:uncharacterized protein with NAD-binding domain and iron-sulfur cluster
VSNAPRVAIFGGGVAGLTAAHELIDRNCDITVFEARHWGGKVRSMGKPGTGTGGRKDLPGEHGFHFFPTFYKHIPDTMSRIPYGRGTVFDNLVTGEDELLARTSLPQIVVPSHLPESLAQIVAFLRGMRSGFTGIPGHEWEVFLNRVLKIFTACDERRIAEFDKVSWADFIEADRMSDAYQKLVSRLPALILIAVNPREASARTLGNACIGMYHAGYSFTGNVERSLNGPPSEKWADPWVAYIAKRAVMRLRSELIGFDLDAGSHRISRARIAREGREETVEADYYICALPLEAAVPLISEQMLEADPSFLGMRNLRVSWMNGLQYFLNGPLPIVKGHIGYVDSAWALSSVCQSQFWKSGLDLSQYGDGSCREVLSVIISDWDTPGSEVVSKPASACTLAELFEETLAQINVCLRQGACIPSEGVEISPIPRDMIVDWFLDPDIRFPWDETATSASSSPRAGHRSKLLPPAEFRAQFKAQNAEPLYITTKGAWSSRPEAVTKIPNFFLASDYIKTIADFASAEGANEAGRKAAAAVLAASGWPAPPVRIWQREEIEFFVPFQEVDRTRFQLGQPQLDLPQPARAIIAHVLDDIRLGLAAGK